MDGTDYWVSPSKKSEIQSQRDSAAGLREQTAKLWKGPCDKAQQDTSRTQGWPPVDNHKDSNDFSHITARN